LFFKEGIAAGPHASLAAAQQAGAVTINYGVFIYALISFSILAVAIFFFVVKSLNNLAVAQKTKETPAPAVPTTKDCPYCATAIPIKAQRCPNCTSELK